MARKRKKLDLNGNFLGSVESSNTAKRHKSFQRLFARFGEKTSMQGVPYIYLAKLWWAKAIWSVLLLGAVVVMGLHLWFLFDQWYSWPKSTQVELGFEPLLFPQVTICNTNILHRKRFYDLDGIDELFDLVTDMDPDTFDAYSADHALNNDGGTPITERLKGYDTKQKNINISKYDPDYENFEDEWIDEDEYYSADIDEKYILKQIFTELYMMIDRETRKQIGHNISDMLVECTFNGRKCRADQFKVHQTSQYGNCWTITDKKFKVRTPGPSAGLSLTLFLETEQYLEGITNGYGLRVSMQQPNTYPFPADDGFFIPSSMESDIAFKLVNITRLGGNYGQCDDGVEFMRLYNLTYTRRACQSFCLMFRIYSECSCYDIYEEEIAFYMNQTAKPCKTPDELKCLSDVEKQYSIGNLSCDCQNPCSEYSYSKAISQRQWPSREHTRSLNNWKCRGNFDTCVYDYDYDKLTNNFLKLNFYFEDLNFENITEVPQIELQQFLSDVGGAVGLWIGLSVLSLCELIQLIIELCYYGGHVVYDETKDNRISRAKLRQNRIINNNHCKNLPVQSIIVHEVPYQFYNGMKGSFTEMDFYHERGVHSEYQC